jgi:hypothetical protein
MLPLRILPALPRCHNPYSLLYGPGTVTVGAVVFSLPMYGWDDRRLGDGERDRSRRAAPMLRKLPLIVRFSVFFPFSADTASRSDTLPTMVSPLKGRAGRAGRWSWSSVGVSDGSALLRQRRNPQKLGIVLRKLSFGKTSNKGR